jgi:hypothetical protein
VRIGITNDGIYISAGMSEPDADYFQQPAPDQSNPRDCYVYCHIDSAGQVFYVGKGVGRRAWDDDRHVLWHRYVENHLGGKYDIQIIADNLSGDAAERLEAQVIARHGDRLVNWINMARSTDFEALNQYHRLRDTNRAAIQAAKALERTDMSRAVQGYINAIDAIDAYASMTFEEGLVGQLLAEDRAEYGLSGEIEALDRLTMCLIKLGDIAGARSHAERYYDKYRRDLSRAPSVKIRQRLEKAEGRGR